MRSLLLLMMVLFPVMAFCQDKKPARRLISVGIIFSPHSSYRTLDYSSANRWIADKRNDEEVANFGFTTGVQAHYRLADKMKLETGLLYANKSVKTKYEDLTWALADERLPQRSCTVYRFKYLVLPVTVSYSVLAGEKIRVFARAGLLAGLFLSKKTKVIVSYASGDDSTYASPKQVGYSRVSLSALLGAGIDYSLSKRFTVRAEPFYQRAVASIVVDDNAREYLYSFGVITGVYYTL